MAAYTRSGATPDPDSKLRAGMYQGGETVLQTICEEFDSLSVHHYFDYYGY